MNEPMATGRVTINASPAEVYRYVSDPTVMVEFAEEVFRVRWTGGTAEAAVGARFRGTNRNGCRRWTTSCRVTDAKPGERFAYEVNTWFNVPISRWQYDIAATGDGCTLTESNWVRMPQWFIPFAIFVTGEPDRVGMNRAHIAVTLNRLKDHLESARRR